MPLPSITHLTTLLRGPVARPMDALMRAQSPLAARLPGHQENAIAQLQSGVAASIGVNSQIMSEFATREGVRYRVVGSEPFRNPPRLVQRRLPAPDVS